MSQTMRAALVREALDWVGTPYRSRHYPVKGAGCDCASFLLGVAMGAGVVPVGTRLPAYAPDRHLHRTDEAYREALLRMGFTEIRTDQAAPGDVLLLVMGRHQPASHTAIVTACQAGRLRIAHASRPVGKVCAHAADSAWLARVRYAFRFPGVGA